MHLAPDVCPSWLRPLVDNVDRIPDAYRRRLPADVLAMLTAAKAKASRHRDEREAGIGRRVVIVEGHRQTGRVA